MPRGLPDQRLREAGQRGRRPPRRRLHRLPVLHVELPVLGAGVPARPAHRHQVRHVPAPARRRAGAGVRRRLPDARRSPSSGSTSRRGAPTTPPATRRTCRASSSRCRPPASSCPRDVPLETFAASDWNLRPEHPHWPLVWLTLISQARRRRQRVRRTRRRSACSPPSLAGAALVGALFHLGRPVMAWKALRNLRRSWLSREVALLSAYAAARRGGRGRCPRCAGRRRCVGVAGVYASARLYIVPGPAGVEHAADDRALLRDRARARAAVSPAEPQRGRARHRRRAGRHRRQLGAPRRATAASRGEVRCTSSCAGSAGGRCCASLAAVAACGARARRAPGRRAAAARARPSSSGGGCSSSPSCRSTCRARSGAARRGRTDEARRTGARASRPGARGRPRRRPLPLRRRPRRRVRSARAVPADRWVRTTCGYCSVGCGMLLGVRDGRGRRRAGRSRPPGQPGPAVPEGPVRAPDDRAPRSADARRSSTARRRRGTHALDRVVDGFRGLLDEHGPESVAVLSTGQLVTEEFYALGKLVRLGMGLRHYDGNTTLCMASAVSGYKLSFGTDGPPGCYEDLELADVVVLWGANIADNHPLLAPRLLGRRDGRRDRRRPAGHQDRDAGRRARRRAAPRRRRAPQRHPRACCSTRACVDLDAARDARRRPRRARSRAWTGGPPSAPLPRAASPPSSCVAVARAIGGAERCMLAWTMGVNHSVQGTTTVTLLNTLARAHRQHRPAGRGAVLDHRPVQRDGHAGDGLHRVDARLPGLRRPAAPGASWPRCGASTRTRLPDRARPRLPRHRQRRHVREDQGPLDHRHQPGRVVPEPRGARGTRCARLDLLVVQDGFETPTTALADVVLPGGDLGREGRHVHQQRAPRARACGPRWRRPARPAPTSTSSSPSPERWGCARAVRRLGRRPQDAFDEWRRVSAGRPCDYSGITWERIDEAGGVQWPCPAGDADVPLGGTPGSTPTSGSTARRPGRGARRRRRSRSATAAPRAVPARAQHRAHRRALAHPHQDRSHRDPRGPRPRGVDRDPPDDAGALGVRSGDLGRRDVEPRRRSTASGPG